MSSWGAPGADKECEPYGHAEEENEFEMKIKEKNVSVYINHC